MATNSFKRIFRAGEYDDANSARVPLLKAMAPAHFEPVQLGRSPWPSDAELDRITEQARREGLEAGQREAREAARRELEGDRKALQGLLEGLRFPYRDLNQELLKELTQLALDVGTTLYRQALAADPEQIGAIIAEAVTLLPACDRPITVVLNPRDLDLCTRLPDLQPLGITFQKDESMERGGCRVTRGSSQVDATVGSRIQALMESLQDAATVQVNDAADRHDD